MVNIKLLRAKIAILSGDLEGASLNAQFAVGEYLFFKLGIVNDRSSMIEHHRCT